MASHDIEARDVLTTFGRSLSQASRRNWNLRRKKIGVVKEVRGSAENRLYTIREHAGNKQYRRSPHFKSGFRSLDPQKKNWPHFDVGEEVELDVPPSPCRIRVRHLQSGDSGTLVQRTVNFDKYIMDACGSENSGTYLVPIAADGYTLLTGGLLNDAPKKDNNAELCTKNAELCSINFHMNNGVTVTTWVVQTVKPIKAGEEILISYGNEYSHDIDPSQDERFPRQNDAVQVGPPDWSSSSSEDEVEDDHMDTAFVGAVRMNEQGQVASVEVVFEDVDKAPEILEGDDISERLQPASFPEAMRLHLGRFYMQTLPQNAAVAAEARHRTGHMAAATPVAPARPQQPFAHPKAFDLQQQEDKGALNEGEEEGSDDGKEEPQEGVEVFLQSTPRQKLEAIGAAAAEIITATCTRKEGVLPVNECGDSEEVQDKAAEGKEEESESENGDDDDDDDDDVRRRREAKEKRHRQAVEEDADAYQQTASSKGYGSGESGYHTSSKKARPTLEEGIKRGPGIFPGWSPLPPRCGKIKKRKTTE